MSRLILLLASLLLPLQLAWAGSAIGCSVDAVRALNAGHALQASAGDASGQAQTPGADGCADPNCASCHAPTPPLSGTAVPVALVMPSGSSSAPVRTAAYASAWARAPDRPQWTRLV